MDYQLTRSVRLALREHGVDGAWALQETAAGAPVGQQFLPWHFSVFFDIAAATHFVELEHDSSGVNEWDADDDEIDEIDVAHVATPTVPQVLRETLRFTLQPRDTWDAPRLSFFGMDREIRDIHLRVAVSLAKDPGARTHGVKEGELGCRAHGAPSYTSEHDFRTKTTPDYLELALYVSPTCFAELRDQITSQGPKISGRVRLWSVDGFYAPWTPGISAQSYKLLPDSVGLDDVVPVEDPEGLGVAPKALGRVQTCSISLHRDYSFSPNPEEKGAENAHDGELDDAAAPATSVSDQFPKSAEAVSTRQEHLLSALRWPLWGIVGLLAVRACQA